MTLLERRPRGVSLTAAGQTLVGHAEGVLAGLDAAEAALAAIAGLRGGRLRMASFPTAGATLMPLAIATFSERYPDVELTLPRASPSRSRRDCARASSTWRCCSSSTAESPSPREGRSTGDRRCEAAAGPAVPGAAARAPSRRAPAAAPGGPARGGLGADLPARAHARATSCAAAMPRGSSRAWRFRATTTRPSRASSRPGSGVALIPELALSVVREDIVIRALSPRPPARQVIAATAAGARLLARGAGDAERARRSGLGIPGARSGTPGGLSSPGTRRCIPNLSGRI